MTLSFSKFAKYPSLIVLSLIITACGSSSQNTADSSLDFSHNYPPEIGGTLINAMSAEPSGLISMIAGESASSAITANIFNSLLKYDKNLELEGDLVKSWDISPDQKTITFKLKPNLKWADGAPLTSADVLFTWRAVTDEKTASPYASDFQLVKQAETPDPLTFRVTYAQTYAPALDSWAGLQILPKHLLQGKDLHTTSFARNPVGSHYYKLDSWTHGENLKLSTNQNSVLGQARIDKLITRIIPDNSAQFLELMAGNIDYMGLDPIKYSRIIPARPELQQKLALYKELGNSYTYMGFNLKHKPFDDVRVRRAINYAIDKQEIIDGVYLGLGINIASPYKPGTRWSNPALTPYPYDPAKARTLLQEAGFKDTDGDGILDTGPIQPGQHAEFVIRVTLPNGSKHEKGYSFKVNSTSISTKTVDTLKLSTGPITANSVDLVNKETGDPEKGTGTGTNTPVQDKTTPPGTPITYDATIKNNGNVPDNYVITVPNVPTDWKVEIFEKDSSGNQ